MNIRTFVAKLQFLSRNPQYDFPKMRGGGQRPFGTFPKIHPFWSGDTSLRDHSHLASRQALAVKHPGDPWQIRCLVNCVN